MTAPATNVLALALVAALPASGTIADVTLPALVGDHMVLQQRADVSIWGWAEPGERVCVAGGWPGGVAEAIADATGAWETQLRTPAAGGPYELYVTGNDTHVLRDVLIGEVWVCGGQSNMEMPIGNVAAYYSGVADSERVIAEAQHPQLRLFNVENTIAAAPRDRCVGSWQVCTPETARTFSATAYFFGRDIQRSLDVPVGLITADQGGTRAEAWMSAEALASFDAFETDLKFVTEYGNPRTRARAERRRREAWWDGIDALADVGPNWNARNYDDSTWDTMPVPSTFSGPLESFDGVVYFRRAVEIPAAWLAVGGTLALGPIADKDDAWVNGRHVGSTHAPGRSGDLRKYDVLPSKLEPGYNVIAVRVLDEGGPGGINGGPNQMRFWKLDKREEARIDGMWRYAVGPRLDQLPPRPGDDLLTRNLPSVLFNGMIAPIRRYTAQGVVWYQGESNRGSAVLYETLFPALIEDWRRQWRRPEMPFYFVQIAPFAYENDSGQTARLRASQAAALRQPATGMVVTLDVGDPDDIHPTNKLEVGRRLARLARAGAYGDETVPARSPAFRSMTREGSTLRIRMQRHGRSLTLRDHEPGVFEVAGSDGRFVPARASIDNDELLLTSPDVSEPVAARYAWSPCPVPVLFDDAGLPAAPFHTDR